MKSRTGLSAAIVSLAILACAAAPAAFETNEQLLKNTGFETGTHKQPGLGAVVPKHWSRDWRNTGIVEVVEDAEVAHGGKACVRLADASISQGRFKIVPGMRYRVRAWMKGEGEAYQAIVVYRYIWKTVDGKKILKNVGSWVGPKGWRGEKLADEWTMIEEVYTAPTDGSVDLIAVGLHLSAKKGTEGAALVDDVTLRAWDGRPLAIRIATCAVFRDKDWYAEALAKHAELKAKRGPALEVIYARAAKLREESENDKASLAERERMEAEFEDLLKAYAGVGSEVELDLEDR